MNMENFAFYLLVVAAALGGCYSQLGQIDTTPPMIDGCPQRLQEVIEVDQPGTVVRWTPPTAFDASMNVRVDPSHNPGQFFPGGQPTIVTYLFSDDQGNSARCSFCVEVIQVDTTDPTIIGCPMLPVTEVVELGITSTPVFYPEPTATDNSDDPNLLQTQTCRPGDQRPVGETFCIYIFTDPSGNTVTCRFPIVVTAVDTVPPTVNGCPTQDIDVVIELGQTEGRAVWPEPTAMDLAGATLESRDGAPGDLFPIGRTHVLYVFTDPSGNRATCQFTVNVRTEDTTAPDISNCPNNIERFIELGSPGLSITWLEPTATDLSGVATRTTNNIPAFFTPGVVEIRYTFTDSSSNSAVCSFQVEVIEMDTIPPDISNCPADFSVTVELGEDSTTATWREPTATDVSEQVTVSSKSHAPNGQFFVGPTEVTYVFVDGSNNAATCQFVITVVEVGTTSPTIIFCPDDIIRSIELGTAGTTVVWEEPTATDISGTVVLQSRTSAPGDFFPEGGAPVVYTFVDNSGNVATCTFNVIITTIDSTPPTISGCPLAEVVEVVELGTTGAIVSWLAPTATDLSDPVTVQVNNRPGQFYVVGTTVITYTFRDDVGNEAMCIFNVVVRTGTNGIVFCPESVSVISCNREEMVSWESPIFDNAGKDFTAEASHSPGASFGLGTTSVIYTFEDIQSGAVVVCKFRVTVTEQANCSTTPYSIYVAIGVGCLILGVLLVFGALKVVRHKRPSVPTTDVQAPSGQVIQMQPVTSAAAPSGDKKYSSKIYNNKDYASNIHATDDSDGYDTVI